MKQFHAVIFDMDGLLLDTESIALAAFLETCEHFALGEQTALFIQCIGTNQILGERILKEGLQGKVDYGEFARLWDSKYIERTSHTPIPLKVGAIELLKHVASLRVPVGVATSTVSARARHKLQHAGILHCFAAVIGGDQVTHSKPHPDIYLKVAATLGVQPEKCLALEDSENGVRAAVSAGMTVIQIPDLVAPSPALSALGHIILPRLNDVMHYVWP